MKREIKFRCWIPSIKQMASWEDFKKNCDRLSILERDDFIPMQFTGLKDENGKEIYEGDIVKHGYSDFEEDKTIHQIKWCIDEDYPAFDLIPYLNIECNGLSHAKAEGEIEVIGNIYENPELLEKL